MKPVLMYNPIPDSKSYFANIRTFKDGYKSAEHWHSFLEFEMVVDGSGTHIINGKEQKISRGDAWLINYSGNHNVISNTHLTIANISFSEDMLDTTLRNFIFVYGSPSCTFCEEDTQRIVDSASRLSKEKDNIFSYQLASSIINEVLILLIRNCGITSEYLPPSIQTAAAIVHKNFRNDISLASVANEMSLTPNYLGSVFKKSTGVTFNVYLNNLRFKHAAKLLKTSDLSIKEIAFESGFYSSEYFCDAFKRKFGITPGKYRKSKIL
jgi:YesN/AraC family two-component response regulator